jgi:hypothetical protein
MAMAMGVDPALVISGISAVMKAIDTWVKYRDSKRSAQEFESRLLIARSEPQIQVQADALARLVPEPVLATMTSRAMRCWERYNEVLNGKYLPAEVDEATQAVKACICRELSRIYDLNGSIPAGELSKWWGAYCAGQGNR